jgi:hypothetical protein
MLDQTDPSNPNLPVIKKEISRLLGNRSLLPWRTGKPAFITEPFADYIQELDNSYKPLINPLEITEKE